MCKVWQAHPCRHPKWENLQDHERHFEEILLEMKARSIQQVMELLIANSKQPRRFCFGTPAVKTLEKTRFIAEGGSCRTLNCWDLGAKWCNLRLFDPSLNTGLYICKNACSSQKMKGDKCPSAPTPVSPSLNSYYHFAYFHNFSGLQ